MSHATLTSRAPQRAATHVITIGVLLAAISASAFSQDAKPNAYFKATLNGNLALQPVAWVIKTAAGEQVHTDKRHSFSRYMSESKDGCYTATATLGNTTRNRVFCIAGLGTTANITIEMEG